MTGQQVWTGSTNMSQGGIFGHSNVGHAVRDPAAADAYLAYWTELAADPTAHPLKTWVSTHSPLTPPTGDTPSIHTLLARAGSSPPWTGTRNGSPTPPRQATSRCRSAWTTSISNPPSPPCPPMDP